MKSNKTNTIKGYSVDVVVKYFFPLKAGIETNVANVYGFLVEAGWDVRLHCTNDLPEEAGVLPLKDVIKGINVSRYKWNWYGFNPIINWSNTDAVCLHNFDIFPHSWLLLYVGIRRILRLKSPKIFLTPHGGFTPGWSTFPLWQRVIKYVYHKTLGVTLINNIVDGFRSVSAWEGGESIKNGVKSELVDVITNGLEDEAYLDLEKSSTDKIKEKVKGFGRYILQIGRIHPIKNQLTSILALTLLPKDIKLVLVGPVTDSRYKAKLDELVKRLQLSNRVLFVGTISGADKYYVLKHCLSYTHMALWESYCNTVHESMSQSCVCVISKDTALEELIKDGVTGFAVPVNDYKAVAEKVKMVIDTNNCKLINLIKKNAYGYTKNHSWREISKKVGIMYGRHLK